MVVRRTMNVRTGRIAASRARRRGFKATVFRVKGGGTRISVTRNIR